MHQDDHQPSTTGIGKRALLIGIESYPRFDSSYRLAGALQDVEAMRQYLVARRGFADTDVEVLTEQRATRGGIEAALWRLLKRTSAGDLVVVHYSGHGSQRFRPSLYEADGYEEVIVPYDSGHAPPHLNLDISGAELYGWLRHLSALTARVTLIFDCCHSGTITRDLPGVRRRSLPADQRKAKLEPLPWRADTPELPRRGESGWLPVAESYTLLAACRSNEAARELQPARGRGGWHGALTYFLLRELEKAGPEATYREVFERVSAQISALFPDQHPQLEGAGDRTLFDLQEQAPGLHLLVRQRRRKKLVLAGGVIQAVVAGSRWTLYEPGGRPGLAEPLGSARIEQVHGVYSDAEITAETSEGAIGAGCRAELADRGPMPAAMAVAVPDTPEHTEWVAALNRDIFASPWLSLTSSSAAAEVTVRIRNTGAPTCALIGPEGQILAPLRRLDEPRAHQRTIQNLESWARYQRVLRLENPEPNLLSGKVSLRLLRRQEGAWVEAQPVRRRPAIEAQDGETFAVEIVNQHDEPVFAYLLDLDVHGAIEAIYPFPGSREAIRAGATYRLGNPERPADDLSLSLPEDFPFDGPGSRPAWGLETLKLIATLEAADLRPLFQSQLRSQQGWQKEVGASSLGQALSGIFLDGTDRTACWRRSPKNIAWTTQQITILVRRR